MPRDHGTDIYLHGLWGRRSYRLVNGKTNKSVIPLPFSFSTFRCKRMKYFVKKTEQTCSSNCSLPCERGRNFIYQTRQAKDLGQVTGSRMSHPTFAWSLTFHHSLEPSHSEPLPVPQSGLQLLASLGVSRLSPSPRTHLCHLTSILRATQQKLKGMTSMGTAARPPGLKSQFCRLVAV